jgi:hypothetical protein
MKLIDKLAYLVSRPIVMILKMLGLASDGPGDHRCVSCRLYDPSLGVCLIVVDRGKFARIDRETGARMLEYRRVFPFDYCVRVLDAEAGRIEVLGRKAYRDEPSLDPEEVDGEAVDDLLPRKTISKTGQRRRLT